MTPPTELRTGDASFVDVPWALEDHHVEWRESLRNLCEDKIRPAASERDQAQQVDPEMIRLVGDFGLFGLLAPEEHGGSGADLRSLCIAIEELARVDSSLAVTVHVQAICVALFNHLATEEQKAQWLPAMARGESFVSIGLTEPSGGSDAGNIATTATRDGDEWVISGSKQFITNCGTPFSDNVILMAATGDGPPGRPQVSAFLVPLKHPGVTVSPSYTKLGWRASDTHPLFFDEARVGAAALLGTEGRGYREVLAFLMWARVPIAAMSAGLAQGCLEATLEFVESRTSFNRALGSHQAVAFGVSDIAAMTATARAVTFDAAWKYDHGRPIEQEAAICKLMASELANKVAYKATQLHGGYGFIEESVVARHYRDARILTIGEGTSEVQRLVIARLLGLDV